MGIMKNPDSVIYFQQDSERPEIFPFFQGTVGVFSSKKPTEERPNQDSCGIIQLDKDKSVLVVADGLGGHRGGDTASKIAVEAIIKNTKKYEKNKNSLRELILEGFELANKQIRDLGVGAGTTLVVAEVNSKYVRFYSIGDSAAMLFGGKGVQKYKNVEQSLTGYAQNSTIIDEETLMNHENRTMLFNALGDENLRIEISSAIEMSSRDIILLASDGLTDNFLSSKIADVITFGTVEERMQRLIDPAIKAMKGEDLFGHADDMTLVLYSLGRNDPATLEEASER